MHQKVQYLQNDNFPSSFGWKLSVKNHQSQGVWPLAETDWLTSSHRIHALLCSTSRVLILEMASAVIEPYMFGKISKWQCINFISSTQTMIWVFGWFLGGFWLVLTWFGFGCVFYHDLSILLDNCCQISFWNLIIKLEQLWSFLIPHS